MDGMGNINSRVTVEVDGISWVARSRYPVSPWGGRQGFDVCFFPILNEELIIKEPQNPEKNPQGRLG